MKNHTEHAVQPIVQQRWSPYSFDPGREVSSADLLSLFEAARWTMSSYNAQPWRYILGVKGRDDETWRQVHDVLLEGNKPWAANAPVLCLGLTEHLFEHNGKPNKAAHHDLGAASAALTWEAVARGIAVHQMIGIDPERARQTFKLDESLEPLTALAIGYPGAGQDLDEQIYQRDSRQRERKSLDQIIIQGSPGG